MTSLADDCLEGERFCAVEIQQQRPANLLRLLLDKNDPV